MIPSTCIHASAATPHGGASYVQMGEQNRVDRYSRILCRSLAGYCDGTAQYSNSSNAAACTAMATCGPGQVVGVVGTTTSDLACGLCADRGPE